LEVHSDEPGKAVSDPAQEEFQHSVDNAQQKDQEKMPMTGTCTRAATTRAINKIREWSSVLGCPPGVCIELCNFILRRHMFVVISVC